MGNGFACSKMDAYMKIRALVAVLLATLAAAGCHPGGETGDPSVNSNPAPPESSAGKLPGEPGGPKLRGSAPRDPMAGRTGAAAGQ